RSRGDGNGPRRMGTLDAGGAALSDRMRVIVIGAGYVGATSATVLAYLGHEVTGVEREPARLRQWRSRTDALQEPGLEELLRTVDVGFVDRPSDIALADVVVVAVGTPMGPTGMPDLEQIEAAAAEIARHAKDGTIVLMRSTVPVGTCDRLQQGELSRMQVVSNPEFLREGHALHDALYPDRIVAGGPPAARAAFQKLYGNIINALPQPPGPGGRRSSGRCREPAPSRCWAWRSRRARPTPESLPRSRSRAASDEPSCACVRTTRPSGSCRRRPRSSCARASPRPAMAPTRSSSLRS